MKLLSWMAANLQLAEDISVTPKAIGSVSIADYKNLNPERPDLLSHDSVFNALLALSYEVPFDEHLTEHAAEIAHVLQGGFVLFRSFHLHMRWYKHPSFPLLLQVPTYDVSPLIRLNASVAGDYLPQVDHHALPVLPLADLGEQLNQWLTTHPEQLAARVPTLRQLINVPLLRSPNARTPSSVYWDIALLTGLQIAGAITNQQSPETKLSLDLVHALAHEIPEPSRPVIPTQTFRHRSSTGGLVARP